MGHGLRLQYKWLPFFPLKFHPHPPGVGESMSELRECFGSSSRAACRVGRCRTSLVGVLGVLGFPAGHVLTCRNPPGPPGPPGQRGWIQQFQGLRLHELGDPSQPNLDMQIAQIVMFTHASELSSTGPSPVKA